LTDKELIIKALEYLRGKEHTSLVDFWKSLGIDDNKRDILKIRLEKKRFCYLTPVYSIRIYVDSIWIRDDNAPLLG